MFGLRQKLTLGFGGLLAILLLVSGLGIAVTQQHRRALGTFLTENWRSVEYGQKMIAALERLDDLAASDSDSNGNSSTVAAVAAQPLADFQSNLDAERDNITLKGEKEKAAELTSRW